MGVKGLPCWLPVSIYRIYCFVLNLDPLNQGIRYTVWGFPFIGKGIRYGKQRRTLDRGELDLYGSPVPTRESKGVYLSVVPTLREGLGKVRPTRFCLVPKGRVRTPESRKTPLKLKPRSYFTFKTHGWTQSEVRIFRLYWPREQVWDRPRSGGVYRLPGGPGLSFPEGEGNENSHQKRRGRRVGEEGPVEGRGDSSDVRTHSTGLDPNLLDRRSPQEPQTWIRGVWRVSVKGSRNGIYRGTTSSWGRVRTSVTTGA